MNRDERMVFLNRLVEEELAPDAIVDGKDILQRSGDEFAYRILWCGKLVHTIPERHAEPRFESEIRADLGKVKRDPTVLKDGDSCVVLFTSRDETPPAGIFVGSSYEGIFRRTGGTHWRVQIGNIVYDVPRLCIWAL